MMCHLCGTGTLRIVKRAAQENAKDFPETITPSGPGDTLFLKKCTWCSATVMTIEKIDRLVKPPNPDRLKEGREAAQRSHERVVKLFESLEAAGVVES